MTPLNGSHTYVTGSTEWLFQFEYLVRRGTEASLHQMSFLARLPNAPVTLSDSTKSSTF